MPNSPTPGTKKPDKKLYHWKYDDGSWGYAICNVSDCGKKRCLEHGYYSKKRALKKFLKDKQAQYEKAGTVIRKKLTIPGGISHIEKGNKPKRDAYKGIDGVCSLIALLESCGADLSAKRALLQLVSAILAGYCARVCCGSYQDYIPLKDLRAPIMTVEYADYAFHVLERIVHALSVDTTTSGKLKIKYSPILPEKIKFRKITDCAYLKLPGSSERLIPQFRDTVVLVDRRFFSSAELKDLQRKNLWVTLILYDCTAKQSYWPSIRIKGSTLEKSDFPQCKKYEKLLNYVVTRYVYYLVRHSKNKKKWNKKIKKYFLSLDKMVIRHCKQAGIKRLKPQEKYRIELQMLALRLFLNACVEDNYIDANLGKSLRIDWYNILLPGCCDTSEDDDFDAVKNVLTIQQQFENAICKMLNDNYKHFLPVSKDDYCKQTAPENGSFVYWGYIRWYPVKKGKEKELRLVLQSRKKQLIDLLDRYCGNRGEEVYGALRELDADYIHGVNKARLYADQHEKDEKKTIPALTLFIDKMTFLPSKLQEKLQKEGDALQK